MIGAAKIARDITERKHAEAELERLYLESQAAVQVRDTFISVAGHEFRTPLNALTLQLYNLERTLNDPAQRAAVERATAEVQRLSALTGQLLDVARMASGGFSIDRAPWTERKLAAEVARRMEEGASRVGSPIELRARRRFLAKGPVALDQVLTNLVSNALKFGGATDRDFRRGNGPLARVRVREHGNRRSAEGPGKHLRAIRAGGSEQSFGGLGLGLWIARQIVQTHGGRSGVDAPKAAAPNFSSSSRGNGGERDFWCGRRSRVGRSALRTPQARGTRTWSAPRRASRLERLRAGQKVCVILLELMMPVMNG